MSTEPVAVAAPEGGNIAVAIPFDRYTTGFSGFDRFLHVPVVNVGLHYALFAYEKVKNFNSLTSFFIGTSEKVTLRTIKPFIALAHLPLNLASGVVNIGLDKAQHYIPSVVNADPNDLLETAVTRYGTAKDNVLNYVALYLNFWTQKLAEFMNTPAGKFITAYCETVVNFLEDACEHYLPALADDEPLDEDDRRCCNLPERYWKLFIRIRNRILNRALNKFNLQHKS